MLADFLESLCDVKSLIDIGHLGFASQSTYSKWSKDNDAQRAVSTYSFGDFAFHTEKEQNPWWQVEWQSPVLLRYIIINNRKIKPFDKIAAPLKVFVTDKNNQEICVYEGRLVFGSLPNSIPLILPLDGQYEVKKVKIELQDYNYLHLSNIHFLRKQSLQEQKGKLLFFANRIDGLGERLRALLNAMYHANKYQGEFYFSWNNFNREHLSMDDVNKIFGDTFIKDHYLEKAVIDSTLNLIPINQVKTLTFNDLAQYDGIQVEQGHQPYVNFLNEVKFSENIESIKRQVFNIDLPDNLVGVHLRTADIVYGNWRFAEVFYNKVQPFYMVESLITKLKADGRNVILFSLEKGVCEYLAQKYKIYYANNFMNQNLDDLQKAFFEMMLMSRCSQIVSKWSGFAILPTLISNIQRVSYENCLSENELIESFWNSLVGDGLLNNPVVNPRLKAFNISHFLDQFFDKLKSVEKLQLVNQMISLDGDNVYYRFMQSIVYYEDGQYQMADKILLRDLMDNKSRIYTNFVEKFTWRGHTTLSRHIQYFKQASQQGSLVATIMVLLNDRFFVNSVDIEYYQTIINKAKSENQDVVGLDLLEQKLKEFSTHKLN